MKLLILMKLIPSDVLKKYLCEVFSRSFQLLKITLYLIPHNSSVITQEKEESKKDEGKEKVRW